MDQTQSSFWNTIDLKPPEFVSCLIASDKSTVLGGRMAISLDRMLSNLNCLQQLNTEAAFISRLVYRFKRKLHHDKAFKSLCKINHLLHNYLKFAICNRVRDVRRCVYDEYGPSKQVLQYHLVNILSFASLFNQLIIDCLDGGRYLKDRVTSGDFWTAAALILSPISRIWTLSQHLVKCCCEWYQEMKCYLSYVNIQGDPWLPSSFQLPSSVMQWICHPSYLSEKFISSTSESSFFLDKTESSVELVRGHETGFLQCNPLSVTLTEDIGEFVSRESVSLAEAGSSQQLANHSVVNKTEERARGRRPSRYQVSQLFGKLKTPFDLTDFICREGVIRNLPESDSLTKHLSENRWKQMKKCLSSHAASIQHADNSNDKQIQLSEALQTLRLYLVSSSNK